MIAKVNIRFREIGGTEMNDSNTTSEMMKSCEKLIRKMNKASKKFFNDYNIKTDIDFIIIKNDK